MLASTSGSGVQQRRAVQLTSGGNVDPGSDEHSGYRQPLLHRVYSTMKLSELRSDGKSERIRWPVNLEDLNWYLYEASLDGVPGSPLALLGVQ